MQYQYMDIPEVLPFDVIHCNNKKKLCLKPCDVFWGCVKKEWTPGFHLSLEECKFSTKIQPLHLMTRRSASGTLSSFDISQLRMRFRANLQVFLRRKDLREPVLCRVQVYFYDLFMKVIRVGGFDKVLALCYKKKKKKNPTKNEKVCESQQWTQIAIQLSVKSTNAAYQIKKTYEIFLLDYEQTHFMPAFASFRLLDKPPPQRFEEMVKDYKFGKDNAENEMLCSRCKDNTSVNDGVSCYACGDIYHKKCTDAAPGTTIWHCEECLAQLNQKFGYETGPEYNAMKYQERCEQFCKEENEREREGHFHLFCHLSFVISDGQHWTPITLFKKNFMMGLGVEDLTLDQYEDIFWSIVDNGCAPLYVEYGSEIPTSEQCSGFPQKAGQPFHDHEFNLMNIKTATGNVLTHLNRDISGMTYPWLC
ncbi:hypothetical protein RFI_14470 [Reticulomyxa filosa]|uniref:PHD-type domain-containing protein n=1 Tax=Reticulomyxa filosa TaxID=46433 RepID=X6N9J1_RETFI|nr:hypothetical protein RFI_14470 [Reticulomyxa filosa]|eukprot:ETO22721.1 hypothetical protein RFI_14470 [Reticulomyxa filosa]